MKNALHVLLIFCFAFMDQFCCAMVKSILIHNLSEKKYELQSENESAELPQKGYRIAKLIWLTENNVKKTNIEFYDTSDPWHLKCSLILYSHIIKVDGKKKYVGKLECKKSNVPTVKDFPEIPICGLERLKLTITDDLEASELKLID